MTEDQARKLAQRCIDSWPAGPKAYIWRDVLLHLDADYAAVAYRTLVRSAEKTPNTGQYMAHYHAVKPANDAPAWRAPANAICLDEYLCRLAERSANGDETATVELERWQRHPRGLSGFVPLAAEWDGMAADEIRARLNERRSPAGKATS